MPEQQLIQIFKQLGDIDKKTLLSFAEFLLSQSEKNAIDKEAQPELIEQPLDIPRPLDENVIAGIKRLTATYPMISKSGVLDQVTKIMTDHMLHGKEVKRAINELELLFSEHYQVYKKDF